MPKTIIKVEAHWKGVPVVIFFNEGGQWSAVWERVGIKLKPFVFSSPAERLECVTYLWRTRVVYPRRVAPTGTLPEPVRGATCQI